MRKNLILTSCFLFYAYIFFTQCTSLDISEKGSYQPFPPGYNYPLEEDTIQKWISNEDYGEIRKHAFNLFAGLNQTATNGQKIWQTWSPVAGILGGVTENHQNINDIPIDTTDFPFPFIEPHTNCDSIGTGNWFYFTSFIVIAGTFYNHEGADWIQTKNLGSKIVLDSMHQLGLTEIPEAPPEAIVIKPIYWPVSSDTMDYSPLPIWDGPEGMNSLAYNGFETWKRAVAITTNENPPNSIDATYLYGYMNKEDFNYRFEGIKPVSINNFYHLKLEENLLSTFNESDLCMINNSFYHVFNRPSKEGDYLALIGMHIMTKEIEDWCMQTAWWHDQPNEGEYAQNRPTDIEGGIWENYLMSTSYFMAVPNNPSGDNYIGFNPYVELTLPEQNRINSNCQNCHVRAAWPNPEGPFIVVDFVGTDSVVFPEEPTPYYHTLREGYISKDDSIFNQLMRTDMNWGIPDRAN